jgi:hypothetical protein
MLKNPNRYIFSLTLSLIGACLLANSVIRLLMGVEGWGWVAINAGFLCINIVATVGNYRMRPYLKDKERQTLIENTIGK